MSRQKQEKKQNKTQRKLKSAEKAISKEVARVAAAHPGKPKQQMAMVTGVNRDQFAKQFNKYSRRFTERDAWLLAWFHCVTNPWKYAVPPPFPYAASPGTPRMFPLRITGAAIANSVGACFIWLNADGWFPSPQAVATTAPVPWTPFLGNSTANSGARGYPAGHTNGSYAGCSPTIAGSTGLSMPGPTIAVATAIAGVVFQRIPDNFIAGQINTDPVSANASQRYNCVAAGLRVRPSAPAAGTVVPGGVVCMTQQILGDTLIANPVAANGTAAPGGVNCYNYVRSFQTTATGGAVTAAPAPLDDSQIATKEYDLETWPRGGDGKHDWLEATAVPNQSCCFLALTPPQTGASVVGEPQLVAIGNGLTAGQVVEYEATLIYAFYGIVSYEKYGIADAPSRSNPVSSDETARALSVGSGHMRIDSEAGVPGRRATAAFGSEAKFDGVAAAKDIGGWISTGASVVKEVTGLSIPELIGEGLGFLAAIL